MAVENSINWAINTDPYSDDPIMIAEGTSWLNIETGADGKTYWWDRWSDTFVTTTNDDDIAACGTVGTTSFAYCFLVKQIGSTKTMSRCSCAPPKRIMLT